MFNVSNFGINLWTKSFQIFISVTCLNIIMRFMTLEPEVMISFTYTQPAQTVPVTFCDIIYRNYLIHSPNIWSIKLRPTAYSISHHIKCHLIDLYSYDCSIIDCYICNNIVDLRMRGWRHVFMRLLHFLRFLPICTLRTHTRLLYALDYTLRTCYTIIDDKHTGYLPGYLNLIFWNSLGKATLDSNWGRWNPIIHYVRPS